MSDRPAYFEPIKLGLAWLANHFPSMSDRPAYFEPIRQCAAQRWDQLERDPELAGLWWQLFKQVQSPRHVLSELLQNADDARATEASVRVEDGTFIFKHDGEDFTEEHFASLCRFGYSNKRALHTIGFRGIGFKSTFSLGSCVELFTPTLSVAFDQSRFTEPRWANDTLQSDGRTTIRVVISDVHRQKKVEENLQDWLESPVSLLFFKHIRRIQIGDSKLRWGSFRPGPVPNTERLALQDNDDKVFLKAWSAPESFPDEALAEIRDERMSGDKEDTEFPPCVIEIVLGVDGHLFVVLPAEVKTKLPFACNAPFIQDPARMKIKDPETSPTNRWLLQRAGKLAAEIMLEWLHQSKLDPIERACAYELMPDVGRGDNSLEGTCGTIVEKAFAEVIKDKDLLLTDEEHLTVSRQSIIIPRAIFDVWPSAQAAAFLDDDDRPAFSRHVSKQNRTKLINWGVIKEVDDEGVLNALQSKHLPKPESWRHLLNLCAYIAPTITSYHYRGKKSLCIVPVQGKETLYTADETVRLGEKQLLPSEDDWQFLGNRLSVLNQNWPRYLTEQRRIAKANADNEHSERVNAAYAVLKTISMDKPSDTGKVIDQVAADFFRQEKATLPDTIRIAQIAAKLRASVGERFRFACQDRCLRSVDSTILFDADGSLGLMLPDEWSETHLLHPDYLKSFTSCTREEWLRWVSSGRSGLHTFTPLQQEHRDVYGKSQIEEEARQRGYQGALSYQYVTNHFRVEDWDFDDTFWHHWQKLADSVDQVWGKVAEQILTQRGTFWKKAQSARLLHVTTTGNTKPMVFEPVLPSWILKLREKECLRDTQGICRKPAELLRRTPNTEALMDVEPFIHGCLDNEASRPLLNLLGVGDVPTGPDKLLARLQTLAKAANPPIHEVEKWYRRLDQMLVGCSTEDSNIIKSAFREERLILTENGTWENTFGVFLASDEGDAPGANIVRASVSDLALWRKLGVADRPTAESAIKWLQGLPSGEPLSQEDLRRARALLKRYPSKVWGECAHWISLSSNWVPVEGFDYVLTMQTLIPWRHLHQWVKQKTADLQQLPPKVTEMPPFADLPALAAHVEERFHRKNMHAGNREERGWLRQLGAELQRIKLDDEDETGRIRGLASALAMTSWLTTGDLEITPYIDGKPAGTARQADVIWVETEKILYAEDRPLVKLALPVTQELGRSFRRPDITDAIKLCFDRSPDFITKYMEEYFTLIPRSEIAEKSPAHETPTEEKHDGPGQASENGIAPDDDEETEQEDDLEEAGGITEIVPSEGGDETLGETDEPKAVVWVPRPTPKPSRPGIMERFARSQGFQKDQANRFFDDHGNGIAKTNGSLFPWEQRSALGDVVRHYWPKDHCLEREPLQLEAAIWGMVEKQPEIYALVLSNSEGQPVEISGTRLCEMRECGDLILYPSTYRLVYEHDE